MANITDIKARIKSINDTRQITKAMELISVSKVKRAQENYDKNLLYFKSLIKAISDLLENGDCIDCGDRYFELDPTEKTCYIVISSDKGLAGGYNHNVLNLAHEITSKNDNKQIITFGRTAAEFFKRNNVTVDKEYSSIGNPTLKHARSIAYDICDAFDKDEIGTERIADKGFYCGYFHFSIHLIKYPDIINDKGIFADDFIRFRSRLMIFVTIAAHFGTDQNKLRPFGNILVDMTVFFAVDVKGITVFIPEHTEAVELFHIEIVHASDLGAFHIQAITAGKRIVGSDFTMLETFHYVKFSTAFGGIKRCSDNGGLQPESTPPAVVRHLLEFAPALVVTVGVSEQRLFKFADVPLEMIVDNFSLGDRFVHELISGLQLGTDRTAILLNNGKNSVAVTVQMNRFIGPRRVTFAHH